MDFLNLIMPYILDIIATLVIALIGVGGAWLGKRIAQKTQLANITSAVSLVVQAAQLTVGELKQTTVDAWKTAAPNGKLTEEQIAILQQQLISKTIAKLSLPVLQLLLAAKTDVNAIIVGAGEDLINRM